MATEPEVFYVFLGRHGTTDEDKFLLRERRGAGAGVDLL